MIEMDKARIRLKIKIKIRLKFSQLEKRKPILNLVNFALIGQKGLRCLLVSLLLN